MYMLTIYVAYTVVIPRKKASSTTPKLCVFHRFSRLPQNIRCLIKSAIRVLLKGGGERGEPIPDKLTPLLEFYLN